MSRKKSTRTISHLDGVKRITESNNKEELKKTKNIFVSGVKKNALNEDLFGRKLKINLEDQNYDYEKDNEYDNNYDESENELDFDEYNNDHDNDYDENENEFDFNENEYDNEFDNEYESNNLDENNKYCQKCEKYQNNQYCQNCYKINKKISKYTKISFTLIILLLAVALGYAISFFDGITY